MDPGVAAPLAAGPSLARAGLMVAPAMAVANGLNYAFNLVMLRLLEPAAYGALGALLAVILIGTVPGLALQAVVARHTALRAGAGGVPAPGLDRAGAVAGRQHPAAAARLGPPGDAPGGAAVRRAGRGAAAQRRRPPGGRGRPGGRQIG